MFGTDCNKIQTLESVKRKTMENTCKVVKSAIHTEMDTAVVPVNVFALLPLKPGSATARCGCHLLL